MKNNRHLQSIKTERILWTFANKIPLTMKLFIFYLICSIGILQASGTYAQNLRILLNTGGRTTVGDILEQIESSTDFDFFYNNSHVDLNRQVSIDEQESDIFTILDEVFNGTEVQYTVLDKKIILSTELEPSVSNIQQQSNITKGKVVDINGEPIIGATVMEKGTSNGTVTDINGNFSIETKSNASLEISFVGYKTVTAKAVIGKTISITLKEDNEILDEVVVVGYGTQKKVNLTGAVASVSADDLKNRPVTNTSQILAGLVPGLSVTQNSGRPGAGAVIKIRGTGTFSSAGTDPLVIIDGMSGNIDDVDPNDIQNISFLKDAASASIYGNRAANGVILIETKKGNNGKVSVTYNNSFGWQKATALPDFLPSWEYAEYYNMAMRNMGMKEAYTPEEIQKFKDGSDPDNYPNVNHLDWLLNSGSGFQHHHNIGIQGGNDITTYNLSVGYKKQNGLTAETANERYTALLNLKTKITSKLTFDLNLNAYHNKYEAPNCASGDINTMIGCAVRQPPVIAGKKTDGTYGFQDNEGAEAWIDSESFGLTKGNNISVLGQLTWETPIKGLSLKGKAGINYYTDYSKQFRAVVEFDENKKVSPASLDIYSSNNTYTNFEAYLTYERTFGHHNLNLLLGTSAEESIKQNLSGGRNTFPNNNIYELSAGDASTSWNKSSKEEYALLSYFGRVNYSLLDRYLFEANLRLDGSSRFSKGNRWGVFPSVSAGWRISEEDFWKSGNINNYFDNLKLRLSYGVLGNQNIGVYPYQQTYDLGHDYVFGNPASLQPGTYVSTYKNPDITWEKTAIADAGIDFSLFKGRFSGSIDYFYKYTSDILSSVEVTSILGRSAGESNIGAVSNKGLEINLAYNGNIGNDFHYSIAPNFTWVKNAVEKLADGASAQINNNRFVGEPLGIIYGYKTDGLFVDQDEIDNAPEQLLDKASLKPGYIKYQDISGPNGVPDGQVDSQYDRTILGTTTPKFYYGLNLSASYKGFDMAMLFQGIGGHQHVMRSYMAYAFFNSGQIQRWQAENCWTENNPNKWAQYPRIETMTYSDPNIQISDYWIRNASFLRLKNLQIGYSFQKELLNKIGIQGLRIYASAENLWLISNYYKGWDPENEAGLNDSPSYYPINRVFSFGLNFRF